MRRPILGLDFLSAHGLLVDPVGHQVLDSKTLKPLSKTPTAAGTLRSKFAAALCSITPSVRSLLASFPAIVGDGKGKPSPFKFAVVFAAAHGTQEGRVMAALR